MSERIVVERDDLQGLYEYARQFDVDDDPVMIRIKAALEGPGLSKIRLCSVCNGQCVGQWLS